MSNGSVSLDNVSSSSSSSDEEEEEAEEAAADADASKPAPQPDLLGISPLPSPGGSRHGSIFAAASELTAPPEFSDLQVGHRANAIHRSST